MSKPSADLNAWYASCTYFQYRGHTICYRIFRRDKTSESSIHGSKVFNKLILLHGFPTASYDWAKVWDSLCQSFDTVIAPDFIGFGYSAKPTDYDYRITDQADLIEAIAGHEGIGRAHVLAHDYGDSVAQELLARSEQRGALALESLMFLNGGLFPEAHRPRLIQKLLRHNMLGPLLARLMNKKSFSRSFSSIFGAHTQPDSAELNDFWSLLQHEKGTRVVPKLLRYLDDRKSHRERWLTAMRSTTVPLGMINGPDDPVSGRHLAERLAELVPAADIRYLQGVGHYPQWEAPERVLAEYTRFRLGHDRSS